MGQRDPEDNRMVLIGRDTHQVKRNRDIETFTGSAFSVILF